MKLFMVGDFRTDTGPGIANKMMRKGLENNNNVIYSDAETKIFRIIELFLKILFSNCVCFCSFSKVNIVGFKIAKFLKKKTFYIMHGYSTYESKINDKNMSEEKLKEIKEFEHYMFRNADKVFCVSQKFMEFMKNLEPEYKCKFDYNYNGIDVEGIEKNSSIYKTRKKNNQIVSLGGGMPRKNNLSVCRAINQLNQEKNMDLKYIVIGLPHRDKEAICRYDFVIYYDELPHEQVIKILAESHLYIQNSAFETFGLSIIEALSTNCNLLISNSIGAIGVLKTVENSDLIFNITDIDEISDKIENLLSNSNVQRLKQGLDTDRVNYISAAELLFKKISYVWEKSCE